MNDKVYQIITDRITELLEKGTVPWNKPWTSNQSNLLPRNFLSKKPYRGINTFLLHAMGYSSPFWLTFKQAQALKGNVRKGEKSTPIVFWKWLDTDEATSTGKTKKVPMLRYYSGFNLEQCEGIELPPVTEPAPTRTHDPIASAEAIVAAMPNRPAIEIKGGQACYSPALDLVRMPAPETFCGEQEYYSTLFHELTHATGHQTRCNRKGIAGTDGEWSRFGTAPYAREELVAEMGAAFLSGHAGILNRTVDNSAAYIQSWLGRLKEDCKLVVTAAAQAQKASDYILNVKHETTTTETES